MENNLKEIIKLIDSKQGDDIKVINFKEKSPYIDYFVVVSAKNQRLAMSLIDYLEEFAINNKFTIYSKDVSKDSKWLLIDIDHIVVHVFVNEERNKYNLEGLWKDLIIQI